MMMNLFSSFDPSTYVFSLNWMSIMLSFMIIPSMYWIIPSRMNMAWIKLLNILYKELKIHSSNLKSKGSTLIFISMFSLIIFNNFMGLFPYIFTSTSHMSITLSMALPMWLSFMVFGWINNFNYMFAHMVPQGTPTVLMPFMVLIESISNLIRPGTLAIRLSANMIAGHLLMTLLGNIGTLIPTFTVSFLILTQILLIILEMAVSIIQAYVFTILIVLYFAEVN